MKERSLLSTFKSKLNHFVLNSPWMFTDSPSAMGQSHLNVNTSEFSEIYRDGVAFFNSLGVPG